MIISKLKKAAEHYLKVNTTGNLNMNKNKIFNAGYPRNHLDDPAFEGNAVNAKYLLNFNKILNQE